MDFILFFILFFNLNLSFMLFYAVPIFGLVVGGFLRVLWFTLPNHPCPSNLLLHSLRSFNISNFVSRPNTEK